MTKVVHTPLQTEDSMFEVVDKHVYLGQMIKLSRSNFKKRSIVESDSTGSVQETKTYF